MQNIITHTQQSLIDTDHLLTQTQHTHITTENTQNAPLDTPHLHRHTTHSNTDFNPLATQYKDGSRNKRSANGARACFVCSATIMNLSWCIRAVPNKHYLHSSNKSCCYHPAVIAKNPDGMRCKCCKLGFAEHCRSYKSNCYPG